MDRRQFLTFLAAASGNLIAPVPLLAGLPPGESLAHIGHGERGQGIELQLASVPVNEWDAFVRLLVDSLCEAARDVLKPRERFEVRAMPPTEFGRYQRFAWYSSATMQTVPDWDVGRPEPFVWMPHGGYYLAAREVA